MLSSANLLGSLGGVGVQPALGGVADAWGYGASYVAAAGLEVLALPVLLLARRERAPSDPIAVEPRSPALGGEETGAGP